jgi:hypothetical protein
MALFDPVSITRKIEATPYAHAPNVVIAYPHLEDWKKLYKPQPLRMPDARGIYRNVDAFESRYQDMKHDHENNVLKCLGRIHERASFCRSGIVGSQIDPLAKTSSRQDIIARRDVIRSEDVAAVWRQYESCRYSDVSEPVQGMGRPLPEFRLAQEIALGPY